ncbi:MAG: RsmG family class I SAM-dependent methyltransferase [Candidatus Hydrogenedentes bacterium]|nr:RsmG family class I SAM-dependent methyltransferase [Candidatus Hydrogenedentota bacterium]
MLDCWNDEAKRLMDQAAELLALDDIILTDGMIQQLKFHVELIQKWNRIVGLVSKGDVDKLWERHVVDSLSVAAVIKRIGLHEGHLLDIGSGGGFPAIPIKTVIPRLTVTMIERSVDKVGFLRKVLSSLSQSGISVFHGNFPCVGVDFTPQLVTARAVEKPYRLRSPILGLLNSRSTLILQANAPLPQCKNISVHDQWSHGGARRSQLWLVTMD